MASKVREVIPDTIERLRQIGGTLENIDNEITRIHLLNKELRRALNMGNELESNQPDKPDEFNKDIETRGLLSTLEDLSKEKQSQAELTHSDLLDEISVLYGLIDMIMGDNFLATKDSIAQE